jgi:hypothetical protein
MTLRNRYGTVPIRAFLDETPAAGRERMRPARGIMTDLLAKRAGVPQVVLKGSSLPALPPFLQPGVGRAVPRVGLADTLRPKPPPRGSESLYIRVGILKTSCLPSLSPMNKVGSGQSGPRLRSH